MTTPVIQSQKLVTESILTLMEFDFRSIGGTARVFVSNELEGSIIAPEYVESVWDGASRTFYHIDFTISQLRSDLTGQITEPTISIAAHDLWQLTDWANATSSLNLMDYRGLKIKRQRKFYNVSTLVLPQTLYVKNVEELTPTTITFTLTPSLGTENGNKPSARKLEL
jgi:hypothetical protein